MLVYTIRKSDLYASGIEPTRKILNVVSEMIMWILPWLWQKFSES